MLDTKCKPRRGKNWRWQCVHLLWLHIFLTEGLVYNVAEPSTQGSDFRANIGHSRHCSHCHRTWSLPNTHLELLSPTSTQCLQEGAIEASQLWSGNHHYLAPQANLCLTQQTLLLSPFPAETSRWVQGRWDTQVKQLLSALAFQKHRALLPTTSSHGSGTLRPRQLCHKREAHLPGNFPSSEGQNKQEKINHCSSREKIKGSSNIYWETKERPLYIYLYI